MIINKHLFITHTVFITSHNTREEQRRNNIGSDGRYENDSWEKKNSECDVICNCGCNFKLATPQNELTIYLLNFFPSIFLCKWHVASNIN